MVTLTADRVSYTYREKPVISDISLQVKSGEFVGLCGKNGSGKTTLLKCLGHILSPRGKVLLNDIDLISMPSLVRAQQIGYVPQSVHGRIARSVFDAVLMGRRPYITWGISAHDLDIVESVMKLLGLLPFAERDLFEISGGERQKTLIARAIAQEPAILLLDEPTSSLDLFHQLEVMEVIASLVADQGIAVVMAIHDLSLAMRYCSRIVLIHNNRVVRDGPPADILTSELIADVYQVDAYLSSDGGIPHIVPIKAAYGA